MKRQKQAHYPAADWHCGCGEDFFGGSAAYSNAVLQSHIAWHNVGWLRRVARRIVRGVSG